ncbi:MAG: GNA1162 family protein [Desulfosudaceae bacterium]
MTLMISACGMVPTIPPDPSNPVKTVAVLPLVNETNDVEAPQIVREKLVKAIEKYNYAVMPAKQVDQALADHLGITLGGQLQDATVDQLQSVLEVDGLVYGTLMDFKETTTGLYNVKKVRGKFKLVNAQNQSTMWENGIGVKSKVKMSGLAGDIADVTADVSERNEEVPWITLDSQTSNEDFGTTLGVTLALKLLSKTTNTHLARETDEMIRRVIQDLPAGPGVSVSFAPPEICAAVQIPMMMPTIGHLDLGQRDFSAIMVNTWENEQEKKTLSWETPLAKRGRMLRLDMDYNQMLGEENDGMQFEKAIMLYRDDREKAYTLYPEQKKYVEFSESDDHVFSEPEVKLTRVGTETIDGHPTIKYSFKMTLNDGTKCAGYIWNATDLDNMTIKTYQEQDGVKATMLLTKIKLASPPASWFEIPDGFVKTDSMAGMKFTQ